MQTRIVWLTNHHPLGPPILLQKWQRRHGWGTENCTISVLDFGGGAGVEGELSHTLRPVCHSTNPDKVKDTSRATVGSGGQETAVGLEGTAECPRFHWTAGTPLTNTAAQSQIRPTPDEI